MCYNSDSGIEIASVIDGEKSIVKANGKIIRSPSGYRFEYGFEGDECTLCVTENEVVQIRRGEQNIQMTFRRGEQTRGLLTVGGFSGDFPIYTESFEFADNSNGEGCIFNISITYTIGEQKNEINFSAKYTLEGKK